MHKLRDAPSDPEKALKAQLEDVLGPGRVFVLGLGNTDRADDGAGIIVTDNLKKTFPEFSFSEHDGIEGKVLDISESKGRATVFFVDAAQLDSSPGTVRIVNRAQIKDSEITTHRVAVGLMSSLLEKSEKKVAVIAIQPGSLEFRGGISPPVKRATEEITRALRGILSSRDK